MKIGDKIIATNSLRYMTENKEYEVIESTINGFYVKNNEGNLNFYSAKELCSYFKSPSQEATSQEATTPSHYDNTNGTIYKVQKERGWNAYVFDIVKRLERAEKKGEFLSDIDKCIKVLELYRDEQGHNFKGQFEPLNK